MGPRRLRTPRKCGRLLPGNQVGRCTPLTSDTTLRAAATASYIQPRQWGWVPSLEPHFGPTGGLLVNSQPGTARQNVELTGGGSGGCGGTVQLARLLPVAFFHWQSWSSVVLSHAALFAPPHTLTTWPFGRVTCSSPQPERPVQALKVRTPHVDPPTNWQGLLVRAGGGGGVPCTPMCSHVPATQPCRKHCGADSCRAVQAALQAVDSAESVTRGWSSTKVNVMAILGANM